MNTLARAVLFAALLLTQGAWARPAWGRPAWTQASAQDSQEAKGSIKGRVTIDGEAAAGIIVMAERKDSPSPADNEIIRHSLTMKSKTDRDGSFNLAGVSAGKYYVSAYALDLIATTDGKSTSSGRLVELTEGETSDGIVLTLSRGGVITGRATDTDGQPLIQEFITLKGVEGTATPQPVFMDDNWKFFTDDRGIYRIYGLRPGRYIVSIGKGDEMPGIGSFFARSDRTQTYYPGVTDAAKALIVDVKAGEEAAGINIKIAPPKKSYRASGRVIDAETGKPIPEVLVGYKELKTGPDSRLSRNGIASSDAKGEFQFESVSPGRYRATAGFMTVSEYYNETVTFEVIDADVERLEIKLHRGASISGVVVVENTNDPNVLARVSRSSVIAYLINEQTGLSMEEIPGQMFENGGFHIRGVRPGRIKIAIDSSRDLHLLRVERDDIEQPEGIEVKSNENISDVRVVLAYGIGVVHGEVVIQGGQLPPDTHVMVTVRQAGSNDDLGYNRVSIDKKGRFVIENLLPGDYELGLKAYSGSSYKPVELPPFNQRVTVSNEAAAEVTLSLDLKPKGKDQ